METLIPDKQTQQWLEKSEQHHYITQQDAAYPALLKQIADPPPFLWVHGNLSVLQQPQIAIVGSRRPTPAGKEITEQLSHALTQQGLVITSGLARGIDGAAHAAAIKGQGATVAVMGTGADMIYPKQHHQLARAIVTHGGTLVSEFALGMEPIANHFPRRNRIISGLSLGVVVIEATLRSGSLITARLAGEQGREVFAVPGSIYSPLSRGCHYLIQQGVKLIETVDDILEELTPLLTSFQTHSIHPRPQKTTRQHKTLDASCHKLLQCVGFETIGVDALITRSGANLTDVLATLATLQAEGLVDQTFTGYALTEQGAQYLCRL